MPSIISQLTEIANIYDVTGSILSSSSKPEKKNQRLVSTRADNIEGGVTRWMLEGKIKNAYPLYAKKLQNAKHCLSSDAFDMAIFLPHLLQQLNTQKLLCIEDEPAILQTRFVNCLKQLMTSIGSLNVSHEIEAFIKRCLFHASSILDEFNDDNSSEITDQHLQQAINFYYLWLQDDKFKDACDDFQSLIENMHEKPLSQPIISVFSLVSHLCYLDNEHHRSEINAYIKLLYNYIKKLQLSLHTYEHGHELLCNLSLTIISFLVYKNSVNTDKKSWIQPRLLSVIYTVISLGLPLDIHFINIQSIIFWASSLNTDKLRAITIQHIENMSMSINKVASLQCQVTLKMNQLKVNPAYCIHTLNESGFLDKILSDKKFIDSIECKIKQNMQTHNLLELMRFEIFGKLANNPSVQILHQRQNKTLSIDNAKIDFVNAICNFLTEYELASNLDFEDDIIIRLCQRALADNKLIREHTLLVDSLQAQLSQLIILQQEIDDHKQLFTLRHKAFDNRVEQHKNCKFSDSIEFAVNITTSREKILAILLLHRMQLSTFDDIKIAKQDYTSSTEEDLSSN